MEEKFYAGFWVRLFAGFLDIVFLLPVFVILTYVFGIEELQIINFSNHFQSYRSVDMSVSSTVSNFIGYFVGIAYVVYFLTGKNQATFGKRIMGIYVGNPDGSKLSLTKATARAGAALLSFATLGLGFFIVIFTKEKISLHDFICNTRVFHGRKNG